MNQLEKYWKILKEKGENNLKKVLYIIFISLTSCGSRMTDAYYPYTLEDTFLGGGSDFLGHIWNKSSLIRHLGPFYINATVLR